MPEGEGSVGQRLRLIGDHVRWIGLLTIRIGTIMRTRKICLKFSIMLAAGLTLPALATIHEVPLVRAAGGFQQGFVRVEAFEVGGEVKIEAWDDAGHLAETTLSVQAGRIHGFNSEDLQYGNMDKGLMQGIGSPTMGDWRLRLSAGFNFDANAYVRTGDGFVTSMDSVLKTTTAGVAEIVFFNPASNFNQRSVLRIINEESEAADITIEGVDDAGKEGGRTFNTSVPSLSAMSLDASDLEGRFGDGTGKWRLQVSSSHPVTLVNLLETPTGHVTNLGQGSGLVACDGSALSRNLAPGGAIQGGEDFRGINREHADITRTDWRYANLQNANFANSALESVQLDYADLRFSNLSNASLSGSDFKSANLIGANLSLSDSIHNHFDFANMTSANLSAMTVRSWNNFAQTILCNANLSKADFTASDFRGSDLRRVQGWRVNFQRAYLNYSDISFSYLREANFSESRLTYTNLTEADLTDADLESANLQHANLHRAKLDEANLERSNLRYTRLYSVTARNADFQGSDLELAYLYQVNFSDADLSKSDLRASYLVGGNFQNADFRDANLDYANLTNADLRGADLRNVDFCDVHSVKGVKVNDETRLEGAECPPEH